MGQNYENDDNDDETRRERSEGHTNAIELLVSEDEFAFPFTLRHSARMSLVVSVSLCEHHGQAVDQDPKCMHV